MIEEHHFAIIAITEVLPKNRSTYEIDDVEWQLLGYSLFHNELSTTTGRGVIVYVRSGIDAYQVKVNDYTFIEAVQISILCHRNRKLLFTCIYRSPSVNDVECVQEISQILQTRVIDGKHHDFQTVVGDFNIKHIDWENDSSATNENHMASVFLECVRDSFMIQHVREPTRYRNEEQPNILDLIFTNEEGMISDLKYCEPIGNSDHVTLLFNLLTGSEDKHEIRQTLRYFKGDYDAINFVLESIKWEDTLAHKGAEESWNEFADILNNLSKEYIPVRNSSTKIFNTPWMNEETLKSLKRKRTKWKKFNYCRNPQNRELYAQARNEAKRKVKEAKRDYEKEVASKSKSNPKVFWKYIQSKTKVKDEIKCIEDSEGDIHTDDTIKAELLNSYFTSVFTKEDDAPIPEFRKTDTVLDSLTFTREHVEKLLKGVDEGKTKGADDIHPKLVKETAGQIAAPLTYIFQKSLDMGVVPTDWKLANVTPIHKKGPKHISSNYRPISLTSILCKIMERIIRDSIMEHMEQNRLFTEHQHGFRKGRSCITQLIEVIDEWTEHLNNRDSIDAVYLDFQKAFDTVPHKRLLTKLEGYGIRGKLLKWIGSYLTDRQQRVILNGKESEWQAVTSGIPQGSVLGPTLFLLYINDLPDVVDSVVKLFADDAKVYSVVNNDEQQSKLQDDLDNLMNWSNTWLLRFNQSKCKHLHMGRETNTTYNLGDCEIEKTSQEKDLGVVVDKQLKFQQHIYSSVKKANRKLGLIRRSFTHMDKDMFLTLYKSIVRPHLEYGSNIWTTIYKKDKIALENVQRRATKLVPGIQHLCYSERLRKLGIPSLQYRRVRSDLVETYKIINGIDVVTRNIFPQNPHNIPTRGNTCKIYKQHTRIDVRKYSFTQRVVDHWNALPEDIVSAPSVNSFKSKLNSSWNVSFKFEPDCYGPEATSRSQFIRQNQLRRVREADEA